MHRKKNPVKMMLTMLSVDFFFKVKINCYKWNISSFIDKNIRKVNRDRYEVSVYL